MNYEGLRREQAELRKKGVVRASPFVLHRGHQPSPMFYGVGGAGSPRRTAARSNWTRTGLLVAATGVTEQGQGTETIMAQIAATALGVEMSCVKVLTATRQGAYGGGLGLAARRHLRRGGAAGEPRVEKNILEAGAVILKTSAPNSHRRRQGGEERQRAGLALRRACAHLHYAGTNCRSTSSRSSS